MALKKDIDSFSSCIAVGGPFPPLPFEPSGDDISGLVEQYRTKMHPHIQDSLQRDPALDPGVRRARARVGPRAKVMCYRMADIRVNEAKHGPADHRRCTYAPTYILRGLTKLHLQFTPTK
ncbi:hypothetical protein [Mycobacterium sp.]|uniref:hypothetical protein n=1 Tax=Mycobacterium sp. TaxID=1785 RepID=UPI003F9CCF81